MEHNGSRKRKYKMCLLNLFILLHDNNLIKHSWLLEETIQPFQETQRFRKNKIKGVFLIFNN